MTYNIRHGQGEDGWVSNARIAQVVREAEADVIGMNEVWRLGRFFDQPAQLAEKLELTPAFETNARFAFYEQGNLVLTGHEVTAFENIALPSVGEPRGCLLVYVVIDGELIAIASAHLALGRRMRTKQIAALLRQLPRDVPLVLMGDMNCTRGELEPLGEFLTLADVPPTFPAMWPRRALDHIAYSAHFKLDSVCTIPTHASDHLPVVAELSRV